MHIQWNKFSLLTILGILSVANVFAEEPRKEKSQLNEATVFFRGAELVHKASSTLTRGVNEVWITELSPHIDINSLKINATKGVVISSFEYSLDFVNRKGTSPIQRNLEDSVKYYKNKINESDISITTNGDLLELLKANKSIAGSETGLNVGELMKMVDYYSIKSNELNRAISNLKENKEKDTQSLARVESQLQQESAKNIKSMGILKLNLTSPLATLADFTIAYFTQSANWTPYYDINVPGMGQQITLASKAKVGQTTGLDWNKVKLTLSTATPSNNKTAPLFNAWFLDFGYNSQYAEAKNKKKFNFSLAQNQYSSSDMFLKDAVAEQSISIRGASSLNSNANPIYILDGQVISAEEIGNLDPEMIASTNVLKGAESTAIYGSQGSNGVIVMTTKTMNDYVDRNDGELNMVYNIDLPYSIAGNGKVQNIDLQTTLVSADFKHYSVPKLDSETFLLAEVPDWQKLGLLSGKANITYDGTYVGETAIDASSTAKKLTLTLGADRRVSVKREKLQDYSSRKFLGKDVKQEFTYKITVKNNQNKAVKMVLKEQYPISKQKEIEVELSRETTPATSTNEDVGVWTWEFELTAGESKEFKVMYSVKYPKDKAVSLD